MSNLVSTVNFRQIRTLTSASIRSRYRNSFAGLLWVVLNPVLMFAAQAYAFKLVLKVQVEHYSLFLLTGLLPWMFLSQSVSMCTTLITSQARLFKSFPIHPVSSIISVIADNLINWTLAICILLLGFLFFSSQPLPPHLILLPVPMFAIFLATLGIACLVATVQVFFADAKFVFDFGIGIAFFVTPIIYPLEFVEEPYRSLIAVNPFTILIAPLQALSRENLPGDYWQTVIYAYILAVAFVLAAAFMWRRLKNGLYFRL